MDHISIDLHKNESQICVLREGAACWNAGSAASADPRDWEAAITSPREGPKDPW